MLFSLFSYFIFYFTITFIPISMTFQCSNIRSRLLMQVSWELKRNQKLDIFLFPLLHTDSKSLFYFSLNIKSKILLFMPLGFWNTTSTIGNGFTISAKIVQYHEQSMLKRSILSNMIQLARLFRYWMLTNLVQV